MKVWSSPHRFIAVCHARIKVDSWGPQKGFTMLEKVTNPILKCLASTNPLWSKWNTNGGKISTTVTLPRSGHPAKITPRVRWIKWQEVTRNPRVTSKDLQTTLASSNVNIHEPTIRQTLNKNGVHCRIDTTLQKVHCCLSKICSRPCQ